MSKASEPAFPLVTSSYTDYENSPNYCGAVWSEGGLTKREYFAAKALQGILSIPPKALEHEWTVQEICAGAVKWADELLEALEKP